jgi:DNA topoisomerase I
VTNNGVNATLQGDKTPETITLDEAIVLLDARAERTGGGSTSRRKRPARKAAATKAAAPKAPAKAKKGAAGGSKAKATRKPKVEAAE